MINPNLKIDEEHNLFDCLHGVPDEPNKVTRRTIERLCWRLADRTAAVLTALANQPNVTMPKDVRKLVHQMEIARHEIHKALEHVMLWHDSTGADEDLPPKRQYASWRERRPAKCTDFPPKSVVALDQAMHRLPKTTGG